MYNLININLPPKVSIIVTKKNNNNGNNNYYKIILQNSNKKFLFYVDINKSHFKFDKNTNSIIIEKNWLNQSNNKLCKFLIKFLKSWDSYFYSKIKFKGKGFRIRFLKKNKLVKFFFGKSHKTFIFFRKIILKKISKYKFIFKSINLEKITNNSILSTHIRPINFYTLRGIRNSKQIIHKRKGKKGTYI